MFSSDTGDRKQTWGVWIGHNITADQKCILAQNHSVFYEPITAFWNQFYDKQKAGVKMN